MFRSFAFDVESLLPGTHETHLLFMPELPERYEGCASGLKNMNCRPQITVDAEEQWE